MKVYELKMVEVEVDRHCDVCGVSVLVDCSGTRFEEVGELSASWGYGSKMDGVTHHLDICESCFRVALSALKERSRSFNMFDEDQELPDEHFGVDQSRSLPNV